MARTDTLGHFLTDVADAIREKKGTSDTIQASDFDTEIENLPSGSSTPTLLTELNNSIVNLATSFYDYLLEIPKTYQTYTDEAITLHTPDINFQNYIIQKRSSGKYRAVWVNFAVIGFYNGLYEAKWQLGKTTAISSNISDIFNASGTVLLSASSSNFYYSAEFDTLQECIQKLLNNELTYTYTTNTSLGAVADNPYIVPYTNSAVMKMASNIQGEVVLSQRISQNETIVAME